MGSLERVAVRLVPEAKVLSEYPINSAESAVRLIRDVIEEMDRECVCVLNLKASLRPIHFEIASIGTLDAALIVPRELMKSAILSNTANVIIIHNHPGGSIEPSENDIRITERLYHAYEMMGITLLDHVIIAAGKEEIYSFQAHGEMVLYDYGLKEYKYCPLVAEMNYMESYETERQKKLQETGQTEEACLEERKGIHHEIKTKQTR